MTNALAPAGPVSLSADPFSHTRFTIKRPWLSLFGRKFHVYAPDGQMVLFVRHKIFSWKDEWTIFSDESEKTPLLKVKARQAIGLNIITDINDADSGHIIGSVRNKGLKSIVRDTWEILGDTDDQTRGLFTEDSNALLRRFIPLLLGHWHLEIDGQQVAKLDQVFRFFSKEFTLEITTPGKVDTRLAIGCAMLALLREIMRESRG